MRKSHLFIQMAFYFGGEYMAGSFKTIGNLAFYDKWSPNYFYFNTLRNAGEVFSDHSYWNAQEASKVADKAIGHA